MASQTCVSVAWRHPRPCPNEYSAVSPVTTLKASGHCCPDVAVGRVAVEVSSGKLDVVVPRGGKSLVARVQEEARVPVIGHLEGLCHTYIHAKADPDKAEAIILNAKLRRVGVCGSTETMMIDASIAPTLLPRLAKALEAKGCELRG